MIKYNVYYVWTLDMALPRVVIDTGDSSSKLSLSGLEEFSKRENIAITVKDNIDLDTFREYVDKAIYDRMFSHHVCDFMDKIVHLSFAIAERQALFSQCGEFNPTTLIQSDLHRFIERYHKIFPRTNLKNTWFDKNDEELYNENII
jgi:hypothetical protein